MRPSFISIFMSFAENLKLRSTCKRASVGCVVTSEDFDKVYGIGYNGNYKGGPNNCDSDEPGNCLDLHAEENCLLKISEPSNVPKIMFTTTSPCIMCAKRIINKGGFKKVYYTNKYRKTEGIELLKSQGIKVIQLTYDLTIHQYVEVIEKDDIEKTMKIVKENSRILSINRKIYCFKCGKETLNNKGDCSICGLSYTNHEYFELLKELDKANKIKGNKNGNIKNEN